FIFYYLSDIVAYVILAWALSMIGAPIVRFFRKYLGKNVSAVLTLGVFLVLFLLLLWIFIPPLLNQARTLANNDYTHILQSLEEPVRDWKNWLIDRRLLPDTSDIVSEKDKISTEDPVVVEHFIDIDSLSGHDSVFTKSNINLVLKIDVSKLGKPEETTTTMVENEDFFYNLKQ